MWRHRTKSTSCDAAVLCHYSQSHPTVRALIILHAKYNLTSTFLPVYSNQQSVPNIITLMPASKLPGMQIESFSTVACLILSYYSLYTKWHSFLKKKNAFETKYVSIFSKTFIRNFFPPPISVIIRRGSINVLRSTSKLPSYVVRF